MSSEQVAGQSAGTRWSWAGIGVGRWTKWLVLVGWLVVLGALGPLSGKLTGAETDSASAYLPASAESTRVIDLQGQLAERPSGPLAAIVYERDQGLTAADRQKAANDRQRLLDRFSGGQAAAPPVPSRDGRALLLMVPLQPAASGAQTRTIVEQVRAAVETGAPSGLGVDVTGQAGQTADLVGAFGAVNGTLLLVTVAAVAVVLLLTYRSPILWLVPLLCVGLAYTAASAVLYVLASRTGLVVSSESAGILPALMFGAGTDYALLLIARYREELHRHRDRHRAMGAALRRAAPAILASTATVVLGLLCLLAADLNSNRGLGPVGAVGILCASLAMLTLLPALLVICGRWLFWPFVPREGAAIEARHAAWAGIAGWVGRRPRVIWAGACVALVALALGTTQLSLGLSQSQTFRTPTESAIGEQVIARHFPVGITDPALVLARAAAAPAVESAAAGVAGVRQVLPSQLQGDHVLIPVTLADAPDSIAAENTVVRLRDAVHAIPDADALVGGTTAVDLDTRDTTVRDQQLVIPLVLAVVLVVLALILRSLVAPVVLVATVVLSYLAVLGAGAVLFDRVLGLGGVDLSVPLLGFVFLVALGVDYNIFLMTRVREEAVAEGHRTGVRRGLAVTGGVISSAGIVLAATFSVLAVLTLVQLVELGLLVAIGVLLDTFVVRSLVVPALAMDIGPRFWWPARLGGRRAEE